MGLMYAESFMGSRIFPSSLLNHPERVLIDLTGINWIQLLKKIKYNNIKQICSKFVPKLDTEPWEQIVC